MDTFEYIGKVKLNLKHYSGRDLYSDGEIEDKLLDIVKNNEEEDFNSVIAQKQEWTTMYHLSHIRQNIIGTVKLEKDMKVLEIGSGCGAITGALAERADSVTCIELSKKRSSINAYRNKNRDNIEILVGNFQDIEKDLGKYDCITLIGVFEYADAYISSEEPYISFLNIIKKHLNENGRIIMAIENKFGLKYFAGCREDHFGTFFEGIENYTNTEGVRTFTKKELETMFEKTGFKKYKFYYPYPDYKFPTKIFSDDYLPKIGELNTNVQNFDRDRLMLFDELKVFDTIIQEGMFDFYSNSFLVEIGVDDNDVIYKKCSNDRSEYFSIYTDILKDENKVVRKYSANPKGKKHIENIVKWGEMLQKQYEGSKISVAKCVMKDGKACCDYITGNTIEEIADGYISKGQVSRAEELIKDVVAIVKDKNSGQKFEVTQEFKNVFGDVSFENEMHTGTVNDIDLVLNNIIVDGDKWKVIDYEWTFDFPVPFEYIIFRMLHYYIETNNSRSDIKIDNVVSISDADKKTFLKMEENFQNYVKGKHVPLRALYETIGKNTINAVAISQSLSRQAKVYKDFGNGYSEEEAVLIPAVVEDDGNFSLKFNVEDGVKKYRIDPCEEGCALKINELLVNNRLQPKFSTGGFMIDDDIYVYKEDPWIEINVEGTIIETIYMNYRCDSAVKEFYEDVVEELKKVGEYEKHLNARADIIKDLEEKLKDANEQIQNLNREKELMVTSKSWKMTKPVRKIKNGTKRILKSNKVTHEACRRIKSVVKRQPLPKPIHPEVQSVEEIVYILCPKKEWEKQRNTRFSKDIKFSILVPLYNTPERFLREMIESVVYQSYENWELCLADGSDDSHKEVEKICKEYCDKDSRIKYKKLTENLGISGNTNACIDMATGDYIALFDHDDFLHPSVLFEDMKAICEHDADYIYTDEATFQGTNIFNIITRHCKPDFAKDNLIANNYICHFSVFKADLLEKAGRFRSEYDGSQDHDLILRLTDKAEKVFHIRKILYYWRSHPASVAADINAKTYAIDAAKHAVETHLEGKGIKAEVESSKAFPTIFRIKYELKATPKVSILIPNKDHKDDLKTCIESILGKSTYPDYEIIIIENNSIMQETFEYYKELEKNDKISVVHYEGEFNYSKINNFGESFAKGDYILLLNNDTEVINDNWIEELMMYGQREDVGVVGAKLYYEDDTIQHAGIVIGLGSDRAAGHTHYGVDKENVGYMGRLFYAQDVSAVTGACMMVRKSLYEELGGLDEEFTVAFNDVDFCLKAREKGYLNIFTPYCELYHYESKSRGFEDTRKKKKRFRQEVQMFRGKWKKVIEEGDPYYNPNFSLDRSDFYIPD